MFNAIAFFVAFFDFVKIHYYNISRNKEPSERLLIVSSQLKKELEKRDKWKKMSKKWYEDNPQRAGLIVRRSSAKRYIKDEYAVSRLMELQELLDSRIKELKKLG